MAELLTIETAEELYASSGSGFPEQYRAIADVLSSRCVERSTYSLFSSGTTRKHCEEPLRTDNHMSALGYTHWTLQETQRSFNMVTGSDLAVRLFREDVRDMLRRLQKHDGKARVILIDGDDTGFAGFEKEFGKNTFAVVRASMKNNGRADHFYVSDSVRTRKEKPHDPLRAASDVHSVQGEMYFHNEVIANVTNARFGAMWRALTGDEIPKS